MAQLGFNDICDWRKPRPFMIPPFTGSFTATKSDHPGVNRSDSPKRRDRKQKYGKSVPTMNSTAVDMYKLPVAKDENQVQFETAEGSVKLPVHVQEISYVPTVEALDFLTHRTDTRLQSQPLRYFR